MRPRRRAAFLALALGAWAAAFAVLRAHGTWMTFVIAGPALAALAALLEPSPRALLRRPLLPATVGVAAGVLMVAATNVGFAAVSAHLTAARAATGALFGWLDAGGVAPAPRAALIAVIATCEEIVFRGALADRRGAGHVVQLAAAYAAPPLVLGSPLLVACAFACGLIWGALRAATGSLAAPIAAHVVWDLGVLVLYPLAPA